MKRSGSVTGYVDSSSNAAVDAPTLESPDKAMARADMDVLALADATAEPAAIAAPANDADALPDDARSDSTIVGPPPAAGVA